ncbi:MAG TPA: hypothetical protein VJ949_04310, partial [Cryomorphaceae bacterium]|nr:hypothetical protein [Cryomorphaceae bacterium]
MKKVLQDIDAMKLLLEKDLFERDKIRIGAEQELHLIDADYNPAPLAMKVMEEMNDTRLASEYALFNLEINAEPLDFSDTVFSELQENIRYKLDQISQVSSKYKAKVLLTGILPSLKRKHLELENLTPNPRFRIMLDIVNESRGRDYEFHIEGQDQLITRENPVVFGGALTSFQVHLQIDAHRAGEFYNWAQAIAGPVLAASANSPIFLNKRLWQETRIALFRQTADTRKPYHNPRAEKSRVFFGEKWVDGSILSQFREDILRYEPLVAVEVKENSLQAITENKIPRLEALNFFTGTIYRWNRTCYGITDGRPHLRIENRFIPSGPTLVDQIANAAFWIGLMLGMKGKYAEVKDHMEFDSARKNFYKAAKYGLDVHFDWLDGRNLTARQLILDELLPLSRKALEENGVH